MASVIKLGRVSEWFKELVLKTSVPAMVPWVQIPPLPPRLIQVIWRGTQVAEGVGLLNQ